MLTPTPATQVVARDRHAEYVQTLALERMGEPGGQARIEPLARYCSRFKVLEVPDPYYGGADGFEHVLDLLDDACAGLLQALDV